MTETPPPPVARGLRRVVYLGAGWSFVALGAAGVVLPLLPTTPFLLLASYCFFRSSPRLNAWLLRSRWFGPLLRDWQERRGVRRGVKFTAVGLIAAVVLSSAAFGQLPPLLLALLCLLGLVGLVVVWRLPVIEGA